MTTEKGNRKDKNQNIQVFVRLRPLNQRERDIKSLGVVEVANNREVVVRQSQQTSLTKKFTFDRAFGPNTNQVEVYQDVVSPLIEEVLAGYNCTVFAYGQTGTGKTHTMVGENTGNETTWQNDPLAGIIPRALSQLFDELRISNTEYTVRVSYLELYNEELFDLLSTSEDNSKLRIYEDVTRKGSNIVNGLEEITVYNKNEVFKIMAQGQERKRVASTLMNAQSSNKPTGKSSLRSHTVFTIVVHMKENSPEGEELVKIGKLNLVDLAGSENISKAGSDNPAKRERARECVNINQSLLTLGRVITALVERHPHIPYRESKLTRILQESLGGKTKTSIIATISPGHKDLEETMSTLEYAHRAKNIQNRPEVNQKMTKKAILKEYAEEIDRLKRDLQAARDKSGVYLANETYAEITLKQEEQRKEIQELLLKKKAMEDERDRMVSVFEELRRTIEERESELTDTRCKLDDTQAKLANTSNVLRTTKLHFEEQKHLVSKHLETEQKLGAQARQLLSTADTVATHVASLHDTVDRRKSVESTNLELTREFRSTTSRHRDQITQQVNDMSAELINTLDQLMATCDNYTKNTVGVQEQNKIRIEELTQKITQIMAEITSSTTQAHSRLLSNTHSHRTALCQALTSHSTDIHTTLNNLLTSMAECVRNAEGVDVGKQVGQFVTNWYTGASARVKSLTQSHSTFATLSRDTQSRLRAASLRHRDDRRHHAHKRTGYTEESIAEIEQKRAEIESRLTKQLSDMESERRDAESRLAERMQQESQLIAEHRRELEMQRKILDEQGRRLAVQEERLAKQYDNDKKALEERLSKMLQEIESEKQSLEELTSRMLASQRQHLEEDQLAIDNAEADLEECSAGCDQLAKCMEKFGKQFEEGTSSISIDMEVFSSNVVEVVEHIAGQLVEAMVQAQKKIEADTQTALQAEKESCNKLTEETANMLTSVAEDTRQTVDSVLQKIEESTSTTLDNLTHLSSSAVAVASETLAHLSSETTFVTDTKRNSDRLRTAVTDAMMTLADVEREYLDNYRVYNSSGATPLRSEYRFPRTLAATSPHERILQRYRAMRQNSHEDDCIVIESQNNTLTSDAESSSSEDSAVVFAAPSPPDRERHILKCTSETDIYTIHRNQEKQQNGKENVNRSVSYRKPSKLPAPSSHKKPLVERN